MDHHRQAPRHGDRLEKTIFPLVMMMTRVFRENGGQLAAGVDVHADLGPGGRGGALLCAS